MRLDRLHSGITGRVAESAYDPVLLDIEFTGVTQREIERRRQRICHLKNLIADWHVDGEHIIYANEDLHRDDVYGAIEFNDVTSTVSYVEFASVPALSLTQGQTAG